MRAALHLITASIVSLMLGCGGKGSQPTTPAAGSGAGEEDTGIGGEAVVPPCGYGFKGLKLTSPAQDWHTAALVEADRATTLLEAGDPATAAQRFLGCAETLRVAPADDLTSDQNAQVCYYNAAYAFATAGTWTSTGQAALEAAATADPARATYIRDEVLAKPPRDCTPPAATP